MATCFYPSLAAEDFIPLPETTPPDQISRPSRRRHRKYRIIPEFCGAKSLTRDFNASASVPGNHHRKRSRDAIGDDRFSGDRFSANHDPRKMTKASPSLGHESEIDPLISQHGLARKIKEKDEEIAKMGKLNRLLQEQVKSLQSENRIWRGIAQDNEAEADSLRSNLQHLLARGGGGSGGVDDAESSCCGSSNDPGREGADGGDAAAEPWSVHLYLSRRARTHICPCRRRNGRKGPGLEMSIGEKIGAKRGKRKEYGSGMKYSLPFF